jgi:rhodanese-related sulfurtransferase
MSLAESFVAESRSADGSDLPVADAAAAAHVLALARTRVDATEGRYAGAVTPPEAWLLQTAGAARIVDVRTAAELRYVGRVPGTPHVEWQGKDHDQVATFLASLRTAVDPTQPVLLLCRSAVRSHHAATAAAAAGFSLAFNILEGFEGQRNHARQRGLIDGWRRHGLPWEQE